MMPEAFEESEDFKAEIGRLRPQRLLHDVDRSMLVATSAQYGPMHVI
jgi:hypothetical protein